MKHFLYASLLLLAVGFTACEKDAYSYVPSEPLSPEEQFDRMDKPLILYQFAVRNMESGDESGWIIDSDGWVKTYQKAYTPGSLPSTDLTVLAELELEYIYGAASEGIFQIEKNELGTYLPMSVGMNQNQLSELTESPAEPFSRAFFAYAKKTTQVSTGQSEGNCMGGGHQYITITQIHRNVVDMQGPQNRYNTSSRGEDLHQWLLTVQEELNNRLDQ